MFGLSSGFCGRRNYATKSRRKAAILALDAAGKAVQPTANCACVLDRVAEISKHQVACCIQLKTVTLACLLNCR